MAPPSVYRVDDRDGVYPAGAATFYWPSVDDLQLGSRKTLLFLSRPAGP